MNSVVLQLSDQGKKVKEAHQTKYYCIVVHSTADVSHTDQVTFIIRYVLPDGIPTERFTTFVSNTGYKSNDLAGLL